MSFIAWDKNYSVNSERMDQQHRRIIEMINRLHKAMKSKKDRDTIRQILNSLINYTQYHFSDEEKLMKQNDYPQIDEHRCEHRLLIEKITGYLRLYQNNQPVPLPEVLNFLREWYPRHIENFDLKYNSAIPLDSCRKI